MMRMRCGVGLEHPIDGEISTAGRVVSSRRGAWHRRRATSVWRSCRIRHNGVIIINTFREQDHD